MRILIACEESQTICKTFRMYGHEAFSCDILPQSGGYPEWHIQGDVIPMLKEHWDMIIAHPPCTYLTVTGNRWFNEERYGSKAIERKRLREEAVDFFMEFANADCDRICIENPVGYMSNYWRKPDQIIQPYQFGHVEAKRTCLWLKGLPLLQPTKIVEPEYVVYPSGKRMAKWYAEAWHKPKSERTALRSKTFQGIADAMTMQWLAPINKQE